MTPRPPRFPGSTTMISAARARHYGRYDNDRLERPAVRHAARNRLRDGVPHAEGDQHSGEIGTRPVILVLRVGAGTLTGCRSM